MKKILIWVGRSKARIIIKMIEERESATFDLLSLANAGIAKCVDQIYPLLYPQIA